MSERSIEERNYHNKVADLTGGACWANTTPAGQFRQDARAKMAIEFIPIVRDKKILEIGCGNGEFSNRFLTTGAQVYCVDISTKLIEMLRARYSGTNLRFVVTDVEHLPYDDDYFDGIIGNGVLHHLNLEICLIEIYRVLKRNRRIFFVEPNMLNPEVFLETNVRWLGKLAQKTKDEKAFFRWRLRKQMEAIGFRNVEITPFDFLQPLIPILFIWLVKKMGYMLERVPLIKEFAGSLKIMAEK